MTDLKQGNDWISEALFHAGDIPIYTKDNGQFFKSAQYMSRVRYEPGHYNPSEANGMIGEGGLSVTWVYGEEPEKNEGLLSSDIELVMDSFLEPEASIGLHEHARTEELYYLLEGELFITLCDGEEKIEQKLSVGDSHRIIPGQSHFIKAGAQGARFIVVAAKVLSVP